MRPVTWRRAFEALSLAFSRTYAASLPTAYCWPLITTDAFGSEGFSRTTSENR